MAASLLTLFACAVGGEDPLDPTSCTDDTECGGPRVCALGVCVDPRGQALDEVLLEITPPEASGLLPQQVRDPVALGEGGRVSVALRPTVVVRGNVVDPSGDPVPSQVFAVPLGGFPGRALVRSASAGGAAGAFSLPVVESADAADTYRLSVYPDDSTRPPVFLGSDIRVDPSPQGERLLSNITIPAEEGTLHITGQVVAGEGTAMLGIEGLEVRLLRGRTRVSSLAITDVDGGFSVAVTSAVADDVTLEVRPTEENRLNPTVHVEDLSFDASADVGLIELGDLPAPVPFAGVIFGPDSEPVPEATIYARADLGAGDFSTIILVDEMGRYDTVLRPGDYTFAVVPPASSPDAGALVGFEATVGPDAPAPTLNLPPRVEATGSVTDPDGAPLGNATVRLSRFAEVGGSTEDVLEGVAWSFSAVTDAQGRWTQQLDAGRYRLVVDPDASTKLPRRTSVVDIEAEGEPITVVLPNPSILAGSVLSPSGEAVGMCVVDAFSTLVGESGEVLELGSTLTRADGGFDVVLPDPEG
jgi:hypothetical protein